MSNGDLQKELQKLLNNFNSVAESGNLRDKVQALTPVLTTVRKLGKSLIPDGLKKSARERLITYFKKYPYEVIHGHELAVVSGINDWPRRVRELRVEFGWKIVNGITANEMMEQDELDQSELGISKLGPDDYILLDTEQDLEAAYRWNVANEIRKSSKSTRDKILEFFRKNIGKKVSGEELRYVANGRSEWARRVRELRTEEGWPITTKFTGRPELPSGVYLLEEDRQTPKHDRNIKEKIRREVLKRDGEKCRECGWSIYEWNKADPRFLEIHHIQHHVKGGKSNKDNLITVCNICHDEIHRLEK